VEDKASWISRAFMHLEALCMPETPFPDDYNANESTRHLLLPRPQLQFAQFGLHQELALQIPRHCRIGSFKGMLHPRTKVLQNNPSPKGILMLWLPSKKLAK
jgi:hypothetical protein